MTAADRISSFALEHLRSIADRSGYVVYSSAGSLKEYPVYLLGHNPGGSPTDQAANTVRVSLEQMPSKTLNNYLDEPWQTASGRSYMTGRAPLQRRVIWLLQQLGLNPRDVPASNLIFVRSVDVAGIDFQDLADLCWPIHELVLEVVRPRLILAFGNSAPSPYTYLWVRLGAPEESTIQSGHGNWRCRGFRVSSSRTVVGLPHLSRYNVIDKGSVVNWIREFACL